MLKPDPLRSQEMLERIKGLEGHKRQQLFSKLAQSGVNVARLPILPASETGALPMSYAQQRQWFLWQLEPRSSAYNISSAIRLQGPLDAHVLARSVDHVVARHASLRTVFFEDNGQALQRVLPADSARVVVDNPALGAATPGQAIDQCLAVEAAWVFDLTQGPLMRVRLLNLGPDDHLLVVTVHHIITDGWSMGIMVQELLEYYRADLAGEVADLPALSIQYLDYAQWQRQWLEAGERERQLAYWQRQLAGEQSVLALPLDHVRPAVQSYGGASLDFGVPPALTERLRALAQHQDVSLFMLLLGAFQVLLFRYSGQTDIRVGVPVANRNRLETERLIGFFVNTQVFKADLDGTRGFDSFLQDVRRIAQEAQDHQDLPFEQLVQALHPERSLSHSPLFQVMYNHQQGTAGAGAQVGDLHVQAVPRPQVSSQFDLTLDVSEPVDPGQGLAATFTYATDLFEAASVERLSRHWLNLLHAIVANPAQSLGELPLLDAYEQRELSQGWNTTATVYPLERAVHQLIEGQVARTPQAIALQFGEQQLTYRELDQRANQLAHQLISLGVGPDVLVGLAMERSLEMVIGLLAVLKAGGAYVPLDPDYPTERLAYMIEDSAIGLLLSQRRLLAQLPIPAGLATLCLDEPGAEAFPTTCPGISLAPENLAYVIYTSGSTGKPKGAGNRHKALTNRLCWMQQAYRLTADDAVLQKTPFSFDVSVWEFFWPLMSGARLVVAAPGDHREPTKLVQLITARQITTLHFVPSMLQVFLQDAQVSQCTSLTRIVCSGEALQVDAQQQVFSKLPNAGLYNLYGPTEAAIDVTHWTCREEGRDSVPIGQPIANLQTYVLSPDLTLVPAGVIGELYLGGEGLARGYHRRAGLTAERFVASPFVPGERLYRSGDLVCQRADGVIEYRGRIDHQVKLRGLRIELGEIEARLLEQEAVREAAVLAVETPAGLQLVGYVVPTSANLDETARPQWLDAVRAALRQGLPDYMVPTQLLLLDALPVGPNGKLDRKALPAPDTARARAEYLAPQDALACQIAGIWQQLLGLERVGLGDNFFELGGHSLLATQMMMQIRAQANLDVPLKTLFVTETLGDFVQQVRTLQSEIQPLQDELAKSLAALKRLSADELENLIS